MLEFDTPLHFTYYKPTFMKKVLQELAPETTIVAYIDSDIVVKCDWPSFAGWFAGDGISLAEDVNWSFPGRHPKRLLWMRFFEPHGAPQRRTGYYLSHAIGSVKPWHGGHIRQALHGSPPSFASKWYSRFANAPIRVYLDGALAKRQLSLKIAAAIGRVFKRA